MRDAGNARASRMNRRPGSHRQRGRQSTRRRAFAARPTSAFRRGLTVAVAALAVMAVAFGSQLLTSRRDSPRPTAWQGGDSGFADQAAPTGSTPPATRTSRPSPSPSPSRSRYAPATASGRATAPARAATTPRATRATRGPGRAADDADDAATAPDEKPDPKPSATTKVAPVSGTGTMRGVGGMCLDVANAMNVSGTAVQIFTCNDTAAQIWTVRADATVTAFGKCLSVVDDLAQIVTCSGTDAQNWTITTAGALRNQASDRCLATVSGSAAEYARVTTTGCAAAPAWTLT